MDKILSRHRRARPNSDGRREQIVEAALKVMIAEGVYHATTRKIAEAAGVNVATLHYHFYDKEEILLSVLDGLASSYRALLAERFSKPQKLHGRIADLLLFIWSEISKARGEQLVLQEMTLYVLRYPHAEHMAAEKDKEMLALYTDSLRSAIDVKPEHHAGIEELGNFIYASFVGILTQWLATQDARLLMRTTDNLIVSAQKMAAELLSVASRRKSAKPRS